MKKSFVAIAALAACFSVIPESASARRVSAAAAVKISFENCVQFSPFANNPGAFNTCAFSTQIALPIVWDTTTALPRTITFRGKRSVAAGAVNCQAINYNIDGTIDSASQLTGLTLTNVYQARPLTLSDVPTGTQGIVSCSLGVSGNSFLMGLEYTP